MSEQTAKKIVIAANDPASVIRLCDGALQILDEHRKHEGYADPITFCVACGGYPSHGSSSWPCATVEYLASMFGIQPQGSPRNQIVTPVMLQSLVT